MKIPVLDSTSWLKQMSESRAFLGAKFYAMYSSATGGIVTDPALMTVPLDDHLVHRGDGIFESFKCVDGQIYNLEAHLDRLDRSCDRVALSVPFDRAALRDIIIQTVQAGERRKCLVRLLVSRGMGTMGVNPYECLRSEVYVMVYEMNDKPAHNYETGVSVRLSAIPVKPSFFATVKSCNYLPNVLMKKESVDWDVDFVVSQDENANLGEGPTENIGVVTKDGALLLPPAERVLAGTTVGRAVRLAEKFLVPAGLIQRVAYEDIPVSTVPEMQEIVIIGTTPDVVPVVEFEGAPVADGKPGPVFKALLELLRNDIRENPARMTSVFEGERM